MESVGPPLESLQKEMSESIVQRAFFTAYRPPGPPPGELPAPPPFDPSPYCYVSGIVWIDDRPQAWIDLRTEGRKLRLFEGEEFQVGVVDCRVRRIDEKAVLVEAAGALYVIELGDSFADASWISDLPDASPGEEMSSNSRLFPQ
jgi:hypothetical protein